MASEQHPPLDRQVQVQVDRLIEEDDQRHTPQQIEQMAHEAAAQHADAPVQQYVPNLVYNEVKTRILDDEEPTNRPSEPSEGTANADTALRNA